MAIFISRDKYFTFTENPKRNNIVNKITFQVSSISEENSETVFATTINNKVATNYSEDNTVNTFKVKDVQQLIPLSLSYQTNAEELSKYSTINYRVKAVKVSTFKKSRYDVHSWRHDERVLESYIKFGRDASYDSLDDIDDSQYDVLFSGVCNISDSNLCTFGPDISQFNFISKKENRSGEYIHHDYGSSSYKEPYDELLYMISDLYYDFYTNFYVEFVGIKQNIDSGTEIKLASQNQRILFNEELSQNSFIQNATNYNGTPISDYIADTVFKNYQYGRPVATLEWIGSPEVDYGTELIIEPRREYKEEDLITYVVMGKKITYTGGYRETLYLTKKEAD